MTMENITKEEITSIFDFLLAENYFIADGTSCKLVDMSILKKIKSYIDALHNEVEVSKEKISHLQSLITNTIMYSPDYNSILKDKYNKLQLKYIALQDSKSDLEYKISNIKEYCDSHKDDLYTCETDYDYEDILTIDYSPSNFRKDILEILEEIDNE